jgi:diadenosine tetraphosphatase ApaH/serine/threonine PP2A family protein phosphatase
MEKSNEKDCNSEDICNCKKCQLRKDWWGFYKQFPNLNNLQIHWLLDTPIENNIPVPVHPSAPTEATEVETVAYLSKRWCELNVKAIERYGCNPNSFGQQRDGYIQGYHEASQHTAKRVEELEVALRKIMECTGSSTLQYHIAKNILNIKDED